MSIALVTGSAGLVGSHVVRAAFSAGYDVHGIDADLRGRFFGPSGSTASALEQLQRDIPHYTHHHIDLRHLDDVDGLIANIAKNLTLVVHAAGQPSHDWAASDPLADFHNNALATVNLLETLRQHRCAAQFIFLSTNKVYGDSVNRLPFHDLGTRFDLDEDHVSWHGIDETWPIDQTLHSLMGASKAAADLMVQEYGLYYDLPTSVLRCGTITGRAHAAVPMHGFLAHLVRCVSGGRPYEILGHEGKQVRDVLHANDLASAILQMAAGADNPGAVYNMGGGRQNSVSVIEALGILAEICGLETHVRFGPERKGDHRWWLTNTRHFQSSFSWQPRWSIPDIVADLAQT